MLAYGSYFDCYVGVSRKEVWKRGMGVHFSSLIRVRDRGRGRVRVWVRVRVRVKGSG